MVDGQAYGERTGGPRPRAGRVRRHEFPGRRLRINPSFSVAEHAEVIAAARRAGLTPTGFVAMAALAAARDAVGPCAPAAVEHEAWCVVQVELFDARTAVNRVGTNLNQAVAALHATGEPPMWLSTVVAMCARTLARLDEAIAAVHRRLR